MRACVCECVSAYVNTNVCMYVRMYVCMYICMFTIKHAFMYAVSYVTNANQRILFSTVSYRRHSSTHRCFFIISSSTACELIHSGVCESVVDDSITVLVFFLAFIPRRIPIVRPTHAPRRRYDIKRLPGVSFPQSGDASSCGSFGRQVSAQFAVQIGILLYTITRSPIFDVLRCTYKLH